MTLYYTQLIFLRKGQEAPFHAFEDRVLPLLDKHNGRLLYRCRPGRNAVIDSAVGYPYEVHLLSFDSPGDFESYARDEERKRHLALKEESVERVLLIEGKAI